MNFKGSRTEAVKELNQFIDNNLLEYSKLRNFDFGPQKRNNTSCLSPYVTHGLINEVEIINKSLNKFSFVKNEKFIQEVLWRVYWKGWLELRPNVWTDYLKDLKDIKENFKDNKDYLNAIESKTDIECFNEWVNELKKFNYLHNHTRMWFASIWIFTLNLPWQLGAEFFMKHLFDGDAASNTLGWRWVAGIQTQGKNYLATEWNIKKFTNNRFQSVKINEEAAPKITEKSYSIINKDFTNPKLLEDRILLVFDNNLSIELTDFKNHNFKKILIISNTNETRKIQLSENTINFKTLLINDQLNRLKEKSIPIEIIKIDELKNIKEPVYSLYPTVGENLDYLQLNQSNNIEFIYREIDQFSWQFCNKGFFNFKNHIPKIVTKFNKKKIEKNKN
ncbi:DNA photolyase [Candidatus Pelagibacter sp.]|jgi:deoxyribodipyrimidine photo-lyase|nr:DNA photolyase [Candidatus Pelagibacter sp.]|tara:strand:+ start:286 stop:1458 length:1173 start_codon:yes stop_codon:yes gene_type:complete